MIINFDKRKAFKRFTLAKVIMLALTLFILLVGGAFVEINYGIPLILSLAISLYGFGYLIWYKIYFNSLTYEVHEGRLSKTSRVITVSKDTARLQVINSVDTSQDIVDRLFNLCTLNISYGFGNSGYIFTFPYLSEEEANRIDNLLKPAQNSNVRLI